ncbi:MAG TPA: MarR family winged helix-turn-helix transcriptional regulator [Mycobacterium sp.]|nr:MarR family winged helix-turn-helix transcriptional regulator [Mycobacterium sp.]
MDEVPVDELPLVLQQPRGHSGPLLELIARRIRTEAESEIETFNLRPRHVVALTLLQLVGEQSQSDLGEALRLDRTNLVGLLNDLEDADLIERRRSPQDRRRHRVRLTPAGIRRLAEVEHSLTAAEQRVLAVLDSEQQATLHALLEQVTTNAAVCSEQLRSTTTAASTTAPYEDHAADKAADSAPSRRG